MKLLNVIEEQSTFGFTGKINVLLSSNDQFLGAIYVINGNLIHALYHGAARKKALFNIVFNEMQHPEKYRYIVEPEVVPDEISTFNFTFSSFSKQLGNYYTEYLGYKKFIPPNDLKLIINSTFITKDVEVSPKEFCVLTTISDYAVVSEIYNYSRLNMFDTAKSLISLRKKGAVKVCTGNGE